jgi:hypothetical protein
MNIVSNHAVAVPGNGPFRPIYRIAADIRKAWGAKVNYAAKPYLDAMASLGSPADSYGADSAKSIVLYFLGNANSFRGPEAKALKAELKNLFGMKRESAMNISLGQRIIYKGDMANSPGNGVVIKVNAKANSGQVFAINFSSGSLAPVDDSRTFDIALVDGRVFRQVYVSNIGGDFGNKSCRFMLDEGVASAEEIAFLEACIEIRKASLKAKADEAAAIMRNAMAAAEIEGRKIGLIPEKEFQAAGKRGSAAAYNLRAELKAAGFKARVKQDGYSSINVWVDPGSDLSAVRKIADKYRAGDFDGMTDCYDYDPSAWGNVFGDVRYVFCYLG